MNIYVMPCFHYYIFQLFIQAQTNKITWLEIKSGQLIIRQVRNTELTILYLVFKVSCSCLPLKPCAVRWTHHNMAHAVSCWEVHYFLHLEHTTKIITFCYKIASIWRWIDPQQSNSLEVSGKFRMLKSFYSKSISACFQFITHSPWSVTSAVFDIQCVTVTLLSVRVPIKHFFMIPYSYVQLFKYF